MCGIDVNSTVNVRHLESLVYPPDRLASALNGFFKVENLAALREVALRQVAEEEVESKRLVVEPVRHEERLLATAAPQAVAERLLALVRPAALQPADRAAGVAIAAHRAQRPRLPCLIIPITPRGWPSHGIQ